MVGATAALRAESQVVKTVFAVCVYFSAGLNSFLSQPDSSVSKSPGPRLCLCVWKVGAGGRWGLLYFFLVRVRTLGITFTFPRAQGLFKQTCVLPGCQKRRKAMVRGWDGPRPSGLVSDVLAGGGVCYLRVFHHFHMLS